MRRIRGHHQLFLSCAALMVFAWFCGNVQSAKAERDLTGVKMPVLGNHMYQPANFILAPFIRTYVGNTTGVGVAKNIDVPLFDFNGIPVGRVQGDVAFVNLRFRYLQTIKPWLALRFEFLTNARLGTNDQTLLSQGISANVGFELGWLFALFERERFMLSGSIDISNNSVTIINVLDWVAQAIIDGGFLPTNSLVDTTPVLRGGGGLRTAYTFNSVFGLLGQFDLGFGEPVDRDQNLAHYTNFAVVLDVDLLAATRAPIGLMIGFDTSTLPQLSSGASDRVNSLLFRISGARASDFSLGLDVVSSRVKLKDFDQTLTTTNLGFSLQYYY